MSGELVEILRAGHKGNLAGALAMAAAVPVPDADAALATLVDEIAGAIAARTEADPEEMELLLDVIEAGEHDDYLDDTDAMLSREAVEEGEEILVHVYGSLEDARAAARSLPAPGSLSDGKMERFMTIAATLTVAALARRGRTTYLAAAQPTGIMATFWGELLKAVVSGITHTPARRRRRRSRATYSRSYGTSRKRRRKASTRRRTGTPSLGQIFGELLERKLRGS